MTNNEFKESVLRVVNKALTEKESAINAAMGIAGEAGEYVDLLKKVVFHGHQVDLNKCKNELGDILFYVTWAAHIHGFTLDDIMEANVNKLKLRYPNGFSTKDSLERKDTQTVEKT